MNLEEEVSNIIDKIDEYRSQGVDRLDMRLTVTQHFRQKLIIFTLAEFGVRYVAGCTSEAFLGVPLAIQQDLVFPYWRLGFVLQARSWV